MDVREPTVSVGPLHVQLHVALLGEADAAHLTLVRLLPRVLDAVHLQSALLVERPVTLHALEGTLSCKTHKNKSAVTTSFTFTFSRRFYPKRRTKEKHSLQNVL